MWHLLYLFFFLVERNFTWNHLRNLFCLGSIHSGKGWRGKGKEKGLKMRLYFLYFCMMDEFNLFEGEGKWMM